MTFLKHIPFALALVILASCGEAEESENKDTSDSKESTETSTETDQGSTTTSINMESLKDPCEVLSKSDLESIDGIDEATEGKSNQASGDTWKICDFTVDGRNLSVAMKRYEQRIIDRKGVESTFQSMLSTEDQMTRAEVDNAPGDQAVFSHGKRGPVYSYTLQWRYGNHTEGMIAIPYPEEQNADNILKQLMAIAEKLDR